MGSRFDFRHRCTLGLYLIQFSMSMPGSDYYSTKGVTLYEESFMLEPVRVTSKVRKPLSKSGTINFAHVGETVHSLTLVHLFSFLSISSVA